MFVNVKIYVVVLAVRMYDVVLVDSSVSLANNNKFKQECVLLSADWLV